MSDEPVVGTYVLYAQNGRRIRIATQVTIDGQVVKLLERMPKRAAIALARVELELRRR